MKVGTIHIEIQRSIQNRPPWTLQHVLQDHHQPAPKKLASAKKKQKKRSVSHCIDHSRLSRPTRQLDYLDASPPLLSVSVTKWSTPCSRWQRHSRPATATSCFHNKSTKGGKKINTQIHQTLQLKTLKPTNQLNVRTQAFCY